MFGAFTNDGPQLDRLRLQLLVDGADCAHCPMARKGFPSRPVATEWFGKGSPSITLVGEAPGRREVQTGRPFVGPSGKLLDYACQRGGVIRGEIAIMNAAACGPIPSAAEGMKVDAVAACRPRLVRELQRLRPSVILAVGSYALRTLSPTAGMGITAGRGALLPLDPTIFQGQPHNEATGNALTGGESRSTWRDGSVTGSLDCGPSVPAPAEAVGLAPSFMATFHPAHILRGGDGEQDGPGGDSGRAVDLLFYFFLYDLSKAYRLAKGTARPWKDELDLFTLDGGQIVRTDGEAFYPAQPWELVEGIERVHEEARVAGEVASDVETDSKDSLRANLTAIAVATEVGGLAATWDTYRGAALAAIRALLADPRIRVTFHNRIYDSIVLPRHNLPILGPIEDTLLQHHAAFPGLPHKLDQVATQFFVTAPWKAEFRRGEKDKASLVLYNGRDALATARLRRPLRRMLETHKVTRVYEADRQQFAVATHMRKVGYFVDQEERARQSKVQHARLDYMRNALVEDFRKIEELWRQALARLQAQKQRKRDPESYTERVALRYREIAEREKKPTDIGLFKPKAKADLVALFEVLRIPITDYTDKGAPVTDKKAMEQAAGRHPLMRKLIHLREAQHLLATYIDGLPVLEDGRVHPDWSPKITGRWGAGKAQNWPKYVSGWPPEVNADGSYKVRPSGDLVTPKENPRRIVTAPTVPEILRLPAHRVDPLVRLRAMVGHGRILVGADFSQLELRIAAYLARDAFLLDIFRRGADPHSSFAAECFPQFVEKEQEFYARCKAFAVKAKPKDNLDKLDCPEEHKKVLKAIAALWSRLRDLTKRAEYCGVYGGSAETVYESIVKDFPEVTLRALQLVIDRINEKMAGVVRWRNEQEAYARVHREIREQLLGRVRLFPLGNFNPNIVYNFPIQAFAASLLALAIFRFTALTHPELLQLGELYRHRLLDAGWVAQRKAAGFVEWAAPVDILLNGHDSLLVECDETDGERVRALLEDAMGQELPMDGEAMRFPAEAAIGRRWSDT